MSYYKPLEFGTHYHVYNCGINGCKLFHNESDYEHFIRLLEKYIKPICDVFSWCLMSNHIHLLIRVKTKTEIGPYKYSKGEFNELKKQGLFAAKEFDDVKWEVDNTASKENPKVPNPSKHFAHLFISYVRYFNTKYERHGSLFEKPFKRKEVTNGKYFRNLMVYIHNNPIHHGYASHPLEWGWSSFLAYTSGEVPDFANQTIQEQFGNMNNFIYVHENQIDFSSIDKFMLE